MAQASLSVPLPPSTLFPKAIANPAEMLYDPRETNDSQYESPLTIPFPQAPRALALDLLQPHSPMPAASPTEKFDSKPIRLMPPEDDAPTTPALDPQRSTAQGALTSSDSRNTY